MKLDIPCSAVNWRRWGQFAVIIFLLILTARLEQQLITSFNPYDSAQVAWSGVLLLALEFSYWLLWSGLSFLVLRQLWLQQRGSQDNVLQQGVVK
jgi:hypothetical protein